MDSHSCPLSFSSCEYLLRFLVAQSHHTGPLLLLIGRGRSRQQQEEDGAHNQGSDEQHLHVPLREAQHPPGEARAARAARPEEGGDAATYDPAPPPRASGGDRGSCRTPRGEAGPISPPLIGRRMVGLDGGRSPARRLGRAEPPARGWLPRYCSFIGSAARRYPSMGRDQRKAAPPPRAQRLGCWRLQAPADRARGPVPLWEWKSFGSC